MYGLNTYQYAPVPQDERIWVQNEVSADAYLVAPNGFVRLWDANKPRFYEKRADATGRPYPVEVYEYSKIASKSSLDSEGNTIDYRKELEGLLSRIEALEEEIHEQSNADDTAIQSIQEPIQRQSKRRSDEAGTARKNKPSTAE